MSYGLCKAYCGTSQEPFSWTNFSQQFSGWLLPYLALISQLPFGAKHRLDNLTSMFLTVGSPTLAGYSLIITVLNSRWIIRRFEVIDYPNADFAVRILISLQQAPLRVTSEDSLLASLVVLPENDEWWSELAQLIDYTHTWSLSAATSIIWVVIAYLFTVVDSLENLDANINSNGQAVGSVWLWLLSIVIGWLQLSPKCDYSRISKILGRANAMAFVASSYGAVKASSRSRRRAVSIDAVYDNTLFFADENRSPPIFNYARAISWSQSAEEVCDAFCMASRNAGSHRPIDPNAEWQDNGKSDDIHLANRMGPPDAVDSYCLAPTDTVRSRWGSGIFARMCVASLMALLLQWGTTGAALLGVLYTPTTGLGCRSLAYLTYGIISTLIWMIMVASSVLAHYASHRPKAGSSRVALFLSESLCWLGKAMATINGIGIIAVCVFQFSNVFDTCFCNASVFGRGKSAYSVVYPAIGALDSTRKAWIGGLVMASGCAVGFVLFVNLVVDSLS
ncbi:hypothetical protein SERLA73DRAFT_118209 [Serpula lacrymans var. lacrymans S7.3]|uniref:Uncharacterized protein n=2 Tax=Serpula lacrymans var. lacrymans TaxID=341189 RepID=F8QIU4_SERL3|nr:hypothetical protein SERLA73DRAFT_118209 [Serpula lacrymans var. lacrymans S7.3]